MSDLKTFIARAWDEHADDAAGVALRLPQVLGQVADAQSLVDLAHLAHHVYGEHLGAWSDGLRYLAALARLPCFEVHGESGRALRRYRASLGLAAGESDVRSTLSASDRIRVGAMAACSLSGHDAARAQQLFADALAEARGAGLADDDPMNRTLAVTGNNLACALEERPQRTAAERELMMLAARTGREYWERAGTWLEVERAEYRLAKACLAAGEPAQARVHARVCLDLIVAQDGSHAYERFFACEALSRAEQACGNAAAHADALAAARLAFAALDEEDQADCRATLDGLVLPLRSPS